MVTESPIEKDRYIDFDGLPVEGGRLKRLTASWAFAGSTIIAGVGFAANVHSPAKIVGYSMFGLTLAAVLRRILKTKAHEPFFPNCVVDTKPENGQKTTPDHLFMIHNDKYVLGGTGLLSAVSALGLPGGVYHLGPSV